MIKVETGPMGKSVFASAENFDWLLSIRKVDRTHVGEIAAKHLETVSSEYLRNILTGWQDIQWELLNIPSPMPTEFNGKCGEYDLHIILPSRSPKTLDEMKTEFTSFLKET